MKSKALSVVVPISSVVSLLGGIIWLTMAFAQIKENGNRIADLKKSKDVYNETVQKIDRRLSRIEGRLNITPRED